MNIDTIEIDFDEALAGESLIEIADAATVMFVSFDIETGPLPHEELEPLMPVFEPPEPPGDFDEASVKYGNTKDAAKRAAILANARDKHAKAVSEWDQTVAEKRDAHRNKFFADAALNPIYGRILAIGINGRMVGDDGYDILTAEDEDAERAVIENFWSTFEACEDSHRTMVGHNIRKFDLPFIVHRSWLLNVKPARNAFDGRNWSTLFVDTMHLWGLGSNHEYISLNALARALKVGEKAGKGEDFAQMFWTERPLALAYLRNDLDLVRRVAARMGVR